MSDTHGNPYWGTGLALLTNGLIHDQAVAALRVVERLDLPGEDLR